jgi:hypothetical protein
MSDHPYDAPLINYDIGGAVRLLREGKRVRRAGWNGKGMWLAYSRGGYAMLTPRAADAPMVEFVAMKTADNTLVPWHCSQTDLLATDWEIAD